MMQTFVWYRRHEDESCEQMKNLHHRLAEGNESETCAIEIHGFTHSRILQSYTDVHMSLQVGGALQVHRLTSRLPLVHKYMQPASDQSTTSSNHTQHSRARTWNPTPTRSVHHGVGKEYWRVSVLYCCNFGNESGVNTARACQKRQVRSGRVTVAAP